MALASARRELTVAMTSGTGRQLGHPYTYRQNFKVGNNNDRKHDITFTDNQQTLSINQEVANMDAKDAEIAIENYP